MKFIVAILVLMLPLETFAYEPTQTHAGLTEQIVEFYNLKFGDKKISDIQKELIIKGAMEEDDPATRATNHFYDPVRNIGIEGGRTAKDWALVDTVANGYSWDEAIKAYGRGDMNTAFVALGHNLHLVEDMGVPDHTRNDQHLPFLDEKLGGHSPYEDWAKGNKNRNTLQGLGMSYVNSGVSTKSFTQLGKYFDFLANYSNKNFFSKDTIFRQDIYSKPEVLFYEQNYGYWTDEISNKKEPIVKRKVLENKDVFFVLRDKDDSSVLSSYFDRLALQIIPSGAGVINLFFKEGEQARIAYEAELLSKQQAEAKANAKLAQSLSQKGFIGLVWSGTIFLVRDNIVTPLKNYVLRPVGNGLATLGGFVVQETPVVADVGQFATVATAGAVKDGAVAGGKFVAQKASEALTIIQQAVTNTANATIDQQNQLTGSIIAINSNELSNSSNNNTLPPQTVIVFEPKVSETADAPKLVFIGSFELGASGGSPTPREKQILGSATGASEVLIEKEVAKEEEVITGAALSAPVLSSPQCTQTLATDGCLLATTTVRFEWPAVTDANHYAINKNGAYATTTDTTFDIPVRDFSEYTFEVASVDSNGTSSATSTKKVSVATIPLAINEIAWAGTNASSNDEWFEIKNNTAHTIDLSQWELNAKNSTPHIKLGGTIAPHAYLVFERTNDEVIKDVVAHQTYSGALGNKGEQLNLSYASTTLDQTPDGAWAGGSNGEMAARATMERYSSKEIGIDSSNWGTNLEYIKNGTDADENHINGTPGAQNSVSTLINKGQDITADFTIAADEERYVVDKGGVWVHASTTLTIEPGVTISFYGTNSYDSEFFVEGAIDAKGTAAEPIILNSFLGNQTGGMWIDTATGTSTFDHVHFENIGDVGVFDSNVEVRNSEFVHTGGVDAYGGSSLLIENSNLDNLTRDAIGVYGESDVRIASSTITNQRDGDAIGVYTDSSLTVASTTIDGVHNGDGIGVYESTVAVSSSTIKNVSDDGLGFYEATSTISNTVITSGGENGIGIYEGSATITDTSVSDFAGSGIVVSAPVEPVTIEGGEVTGNSIGVSMDAGSAVLTGVSVHDNGMSETDNVVVW